MFRSALLAVVSTVVLGTVAAMAADLPAEKGPPVYAPPPVPIFSWTGFYIGAQAGYEWGSTRDDQFFSRATPAIFSPIASYNPNGVIGGAHIGYNYQVSQFVFGVEGDVDGANYRGGVTSPDALAPAILVTETTRIEFQGSVRGRVGWAFDRVLFYGTGGVAFGSIRSTFGDTLGPAVATSTVGRVGWTAGAGIEYAIDNNWSVRAEYRYTDFGHLNYGVDAATGAAGISVSKRVTTNIATAGFSYKFGDVPPPAPAVVTKY